MDQARHLQMNVPRSARVAAPTLASHENGEQAGGDYHHKQDATAPPIWILLVVILGRSPAQILSQSDLTALSLSGMPGLGVRLRLGLRLRIRFSRRLWLRLGLGTLVFRRDFQHKMERILGPLPIHFPVFLASISAKSSRERLCARIICSWVSLDSTLARPLIAPSLPEAAEILYHA